MMLQQSTDRQGGIWLQQFRCQTSSWLWPPKDSKHLHPSIPTKHNDKNARKEIKYMKETPALEVNASGRDPPHWWDTRHCCSDN